MGILSHLAEDFDDNEEKMNLKIESVVNTILKRQAKEIEDTIYNNLLVRLATTFMFSEKQTYTRKELLELVRKEAQKIYGNN